MMDFFRENGVLYRSASRCKICKHGPGWCRKQGVQGHLPSFDPEEAANMNETDVETAVR